jgi:hypothetical protein
MEGPSRVGERIAGGWRSRVSTCPTIGLSYLPGQRRTGPILSWPPCGRLFFSGGGVSVGLFFFPSPSLAPPTNADCTHTHSD